MKTLKGVLLELLQLKDLTPNFCQKHGINQQAVRSCLLKHLQQQENNNSSVYSPEGSSTPVNKNDGELEAKEIVVFIKQEFDSDDDEHNIYKEVDNEQYNVRRVAKSCEKTEPGQETDIVKQEPDHVDMEQSNMNEELVKVKHELQDLDDLEHLNTSKIDQRIEIANHDADKEDVSSLSFCPPQLITHSEQRKCVVCPTIVTKGDPHVHCLAHVACVKKHIWDPRLCKYCISLASEVRQGDPKSLSVWRKRLGNMRRNAKRALGNPDILDPQASEFAPLLRLRLSDSVVLQTAAHSASDPSSDTRYIPYSRVPITPSDNQPNSSVSEPELLPSAPLEHLNRRGYYIHPHCQECPYNKTSPGVPGLGVHRTDNEYNVNTYNQNNLTFPESINGNYSDGTTHEQNKKDDASNVSRQFSKNLVITASNLAENYKNVIQYNKWAKFGLSEPVSHLAQAQGQSPDSVQVSSDPQPHKECSLPSSQSPNALKVGTVPENGGSFKYPTCYETKVCKKKRNVRGAPGVIVLAAAINTKSELTHWMYHFTFLNKSKWLLVNSRDNIYSLLFSYRCGRRINLRSQSIETRPRCPMRISALIHKGKKVPKCIISIRGRHEHAPRADYTRLSKETVETYNKYFEQGMAPAAAIRRHQDKFRAREDEEALNNSTLNPQLSTVGRLRYCWLSKNTGKIKVESILEKIDQLKRRNPCLRLEYEMVTESEDENRFALVLVTDFMMRVHQEVVNSAEVVRLKTFNFFALYDISLTVLMCSSPAGALPLGVLVTSHETPETYNKAFSLLQKIIGEHGFYGRKTPECIIADDKDAQRKALQQMWPNAHLCYSEFDVLQQTWSWLRKTKNNIKEVDRKQLLKITKSLVFASAKDDFERNLNDLSCNLASTYNHFVSYLEQWLSKKSAWSLPWWSGHELRGHHTHHYCDAMMIVIDEILLKRSEINNVEQLVSFMDDIYDKYLQQRLLDVALCRKKPSAMHLQDLPLENITHVQEQAFLVLSTIGKGTIGKGTIGKGTSCKCTTSKCTTSKCTTSKCTTSKCTIGKCTMGNQTFTVNLDICVCSCRYRSIGRICEHLVACARYTSCWLPRTCPLSSEESQQWVQVAVGKEKTSPDLIPNLGIADEERKVAGHSSVLEDLLNSEMVQTRETNCSNISSEEKEKHPKDFERNIKQTLNSLEGRLKKYNNEEVRKAFETFSSSVDNITDSNELASFLTAASMKEMPCERGMISKTVNISGQHASNTPHERPNTSWCKKSVPQLQRKRSHPNDIDVNQPSPKVIRPTIIVTLNEYAKQLNNSD